MFNRKRQINALVLGMVCGLILGCNQNTPPTQSEKTNKDESTTVTTKRPITPEQPNNRDESIDRANTGVNVRDQDGMAKTPMDQKENEPDINITADIRKRVVDGEFSLDAQNVKIITQDGKVTLRGLVKNEEEKQNIERIARDVAGADKVDNQLEVK
jgi:hypothetical protein